MKDEDTRERIHLPNVASGTESYCVSGPSVQRRTEKKKEKFLIMKENVGLIAICCAMYRLTVRRMLQALCHNGAVNVKTF